MQNETWPELSFDKNEETNNTIHLWTQIAGKIKLAVMSWINHSWHVTLLVNSSGLTTGPLSYNNKLFQININFLKHQQEILNCDTKKKKMFGFLSLSVADYYKNIL